MSEEFPQPLMPEQNTKADPYRQDIEDVGITETTGIDGESDDAQPVAEQAPVVADPTPESLLPPEARGEANGGPLGCCLGVTIGLVLSLSIAIVGRLYGDTFASVFQGYLAIMIRVVMALVAIGAAILFGYFGWKIGKRAYREYDSPVVKNNRQKAKARKV
ncbi:MAG TPA: hypothetical protein VKU38_00215 [Ktedonobacteraceae bacterium]|nr:hypothetical protein [Ktedonobacteraceae bacterium]